MGIVITQQGLDETRSGCGVVSLRGRTPRVKQQLDRIDAQRRSDPLDVVEGHVPLAGLQPTDIDPVKARGQSKPLLAPAHSCTDPADIADEGRAQGAGRELLHDANGRSSSASFDYMLITSTGIFWPLARRSPHLATARIPCAGIASGRRLLHRTGCSRAASVIVRHAHRHKAEKSGSPRRCMDSRIPRMALSGCRSASLPRRAWAGPQRPGPRRRPPERFAASASPCGPP